MKKKHLIWVGAGGTGGHISPAAAVADKLKSKGCEIVFFTLPRNRDYPDLKSRSDQYKNLVFYNAPMFVASPLKMFKFFKDLLLCWHTLNLEAKKGRPDAVIGFGGYPSFPLVLWAKFKSVNLYLHEQNSLFGRVTRLMARYAKKVFLSFPARPRIGNEVFTGNALRDQFDVSSVSKEASKKKTFSTVKNILIIGGSQGARDLNNLYIAMINNHAFSKIKICISTGPDEFETIKNQSRKQDSVLDFITDMPQKMSTADLIISRAGSGLIFEILWARVPAVLIPYPFAMDDHQKENAWQLSREELAELIDIRPFDADRTVSTIVDLINSGKLENISRSLADHNFPLKGSEIIANEIINDLS